MMRADGLKVIQTYGITYETFYVQYLDGKEWINAVGTWGKAPLTMSVHPFFTDVDAAKYTADALHKFTGNLTRVVKEEKTQ